jgi:hypothetical protein
MWTQAVLALSEYSDKEKDNSEFTKYIIVV